MKDVVLLGHHAFWVLTILNLIIGLVIGFFVKSIMDVFVSAGGLITQQIGFGAVRYFDQSSSQQVGPFEKIIHWTIVVTIISSGALIPMLKGGLMSFETITAYNLTKLSNTPLFYLEMYKSIFISALMLSSPIIFTNLLITGVLGIMARTVPQVNVLMVSFIVNIGMGLLVFSVTSYEFFSVAYDMYIKKLGDIFQFLT
jgi:flagellar biosynthetic protein FliR